MNCFHVKVNIYSNIEVGQGKAKKARVQEKENDNGDTNNDGLESDFNKDDVSDDDDIC